MALEEIFDDETLDLVIRVCEMYYRDGMTQEAIARAVGVSRPMVSRLLSAARAKGIVSFSINDPRNSMRRIADELRDRFQLRAVYVVSGAGTDDEIKKRIGVRAAQVLEQSLQPNQVLGIGRGATVFYTVSALSGSRRVPGLRVTPLVGGAGLHDAKFQVNEMARMASEKLGGSCVFFQVPYYVTSPKIKKALLEDAAIAQCVSMWSNLDCALVGIGRIASTRDSLFLARIRAAEEYSKRRIVADICGRFLDENGEVVTEETDVVMGIDLPALRRSGTVLAVAGGIDKVSAIKAALKGHWVDVLVTDVSAAAGILETS
ncbi:MAG: sugar-binding transcriptional regulator [Firmicutes bacterium]|nr:sugar-binding transcriptional regulator [Candidatus Fermentithermobacillaceae bacterium]